MNKFEYLTMVSDEEDHLDICTWLQSMSEKKQRISMLNYYMEMPVESKSLVDFSDNSWVVTPSETHLKVIMDKRKIIIKKSDGISIVANCQGIDQKSGEVVLDGFRYITLLTDRRDSCRIRLLKPINVALKPEMGTMAGTLQDISIGGCRVHIFMRTLQAGAKIAVNLKTFDMTTNTILNITLKATVINVNNAKIPVIVNLQFDYDKEMEDSLIYYINQRQIDAMKSIKESLL